MKKTLILMLLTLCSIGASAQRNMTTFNIKAGWGIMPALTSWGPEIATGPSFQVECNIPIDKSKTWTFSPSIVTNLEIYEFGVQIYAPLQFGKKVSMGHRMLFFPKFGIAAGMMAGRYLYGILGPTASLDFELGHFVIGINSHISILPFDELMYASQLTVGYKF